MRAREHRHKVLIRAKLRAGGLPIDACIRDISSKGLMVQAKVPPPRGTYVEVVTASQTIVGRVVWGKDMRFGILTRDKVQIEMIVGELRAPRPAQASDPRLTNALRPAPAVRADALSQTRGKALEFCALVVFGLALIAAVASASYETLSRPFQDISAKLRGAP